MYLPQFELLCEGDKPLCGGVFLPEKLSLLCDSWQMITFLSDISVDRACWHITQLDLAVG